MDTRELWESSDRIAWHGALDSYWLGFSQEQQSVEERFESLTIDELVGMDADGWERFLRDEYFKWKYTSHFLLAIARKNLANFEKREGLQALDERRRRLVAVVPENTEVALVTAKQIPGLGYSGASGLLALLYPEHFGTVDQFVVRELRKVRLPEDWLLEQMNAEALDGADALVLIRIMQRKARELTQVLREPWTPRMVDKVLWGIRKKVVTGGT